LPYKGKNQQNNKINLTKITKTMKTIFKSITLIMVAMITAQVVHAQTTPPPAIITGTTQGSDDIKVSAKILKPIQVDALDELKFGAVATGTLPTYSPLQNGTITAVPSPSKQLGRVTVDATFEEILGISFPLSVELFNRTTGNVNDKILYVPQVAVVAGLQTTNAGAVYIGTDAAVPSTGITDGTNTALGMGVANQGDPAGYMITRLASGVETNTLFFGGWLIDSGSTPSRGSVPTGALPSTLPSGVYDALMTIQVNYYL
jgi:hypothetical protein